MMPQWETCQAISQGCLLDSTNTSDPLAWTTANCSQGSVPSYYINITSPEDVLAAYNFARSTNVSLVVKNTGHDYKGRSSRRHGLGLWTHNLKGIEYSTAFTPEGCPSSISYRVFSINAGETFESAYQYANELNVTLIGGYHQTIGASGGWVMGGGHSVLSPVYGLGVDRVVQYKIVTPDGVFRTANECQNVDLFWALRGGGGGTFGVVVQSSQVVEPQPIKMQVASISFTPNGTESEIAWLSILVNNTYKWGAEGWGGHMRGTSLINVNPLLTLEEATESLAEVVAFATAHNGTVVIEELQNWYEFFEQYILSAEASVGETIVLGTRLMPATLFQSDEGRTSLVNVLTDIVDRGASPYIVVGTPFLYNGSIAGGRTSVTPAWYNSLWHMSYSDTWSFNSTLPGIIAKYRDNTEMVDAFRAIAPESGSYFNEGDVYEKDHEESYWGLENYEGLLKVKQKYDPDGLLNCWQCVGWSGADDRNFECYPNISD